MSIEKVPSLAPLLESVRLTDESPLEAMIQSGLIYRPQRSDEKEFTHQDRFVAGFAALVMNMKDHDEVSFQAAAQRLIGDIDALINAQINHVLHTPEMYEMESTWRGLENLVKNVNTKANIQIDILDVTKAELADDFDTNSVDISKCFMFKNVYSDEYDQYGGRPFGVMVGLYEFDNTRADLNWLTTMGKLANAAHAPFISAVSPKFFGFDTAAGLAELKDLSGLLQHPRFGGWNQLRETEGAAYLGLTFPRFILREPYNPDSNPARTINFVEEVGGDPESAGADRNNDGYLWGNSAILLARNMARSFETSGWCQYLRGPKGGGLIGGLPVHSFTENGEEQIKVPVEISIPDHRELEFANAGFIPLIYRKGTADATFFSVQSAKAPHKFKDPKDSENSQLVANLSYTLSITRIAHYVKMIMRDNIGSTAEETYIQRVLENWLGSKVTTVQDPDRLTLRSFPFKATAVQVTKRPGQIGMYDCVISVLPHLQFEGMDVELRLESRLG
ncbi:MAG: type VI secretion system contractile sheath large subunit [Deltaproteobacteria bacterium]|nr:type VI secretion system contractile sheath large subunit [Deltaproteobacteria bacterium]